MALLMLAAGSAVAQQAPVQLPGTVEPGRPSLPARLEEERRVPKAQLQFSIPAQRKGAPAGAAADLRFTLSRVLIDGAQTIPVQQEFAAPLAGLLARPVTLGDVSAVAEAIQARYLAAGYGLTRVFVPAQEIKDGTITIKVIEGHLEKVRVEGGSADDRLLVEARLAPALAARPAQVPLIERGLLLVDDLPGVTVTGLIRPGDAFGAAELLVGVERAPWGLVAGIGNRGSDFAGPWSGFVDLATNDALGLGEQLGATLSATPEIKEQRSANLRWLQPLSGDGLTLTSNGNYSRGRPGAALKPFAVATESYGFGQRLSWPLIRSRARNLSLEGGWNAQRATVRILNAPFSRDDWRSVDIRAIFTAQHLLGGDVLAMGGVTRGLGILGATEKGSLKASRPKVEPDFTKFSGELGYATLIGAGVSASLTIGGQYSPDTLPAGEEFALGGSRFGRGYNGGDLSGPSGIGGGLELRRRFDPGIAYVDGITPYAFIDSGRVWDSVAADTHLVSAGGGLRIGLVGKASLMLEGARTLRRLPIPGATRERTRLFVDLTVQL